MAASRMLDFRLLGPLEVWAGGAPLSDASTPSLMYGNKFGLFGSRVKARRLLRRLRLFVGRIVATSNDPYAP
jgi:hypothetical protein